jgi:hypothetical protein
LNNHLGPKPFAADFVRSNGERTELTPGERTFQHAKERAANFVCDCEWEPLAVREDRFVDVGHGWIEEVVPATLH